jgi:hypothetical protein
MPRHRKASIQDVALLFDYNPYTGTLHEWGMTEKPSPTLVQRLQDARLPLKQWRKFAHPYEIIEVREVNPEPAGRIDSRTGFIIIYRGSAQFYAHSIVWLKHYGKPADDSIVHINNDRSDNRIENLGLMTDVLIKRIKPHRARVRTPTGLVHLGYFATLQERDAAVFAHRIGIRENT